MLMLIYLHFFSISVIVATMSTIKSNTNKIESVYALKKSNEKSNEGPNFLYRRIGAAAVGVCLLVGGIVGAHSVYEKVTKPNTEISQEYKFTGSNSIESIDGQIMTFSKEIKPYNIEEGDGMNAIAYQIDNINDVNPSNLHIVGEYIEDMPENAGTLGNNKLPQAGETVYVPQEVNVTESESKD